MMAGSSRGADDAASPRQERGVTTMDQRFTTEQPMTPDGVRSFLWRWVVTNLVEAERLGEKAVSRFAAVLEPGDALSVVEEAIEVVAELAARRPVYASGVTGLLVHQVPWVTARRARRLRPLVEVPCGLGHADVAWLEGLGEPVDGLSLALVRRPTPMLGEEVRAAAALEVLGQLSRRLRTSLESGIGSLGRHLGLAAPGSPAAAPKAAGAAWRKRVERGREALFRWASLAATGTEGEVLALLARRARVDGYRQWRARLLEQLALDPVPGAAANLVEAEPARLARPGPVQP
jgi:hypothetical protein